MISTDDVTAAFPQAASFDPETVQGWVDVANATIHEERVKDLRTLTVAQVAFVMHQLEKPALNLRAPHVVARVSVPGRNAAWVKTPHPWAGTAHGDRLRAAVKF